MARSRVPAHSGPFAISSLITNRCRELGLRRSELVRRLGYWNITKGLRRLDALCAGEVRLTKDMIRALPGALEVPEHLVESAVEEIREAERRQAAEREAAWRAAFKPHAIVLTERSVPSPIFVAALTNAAALRRLDFDVTADPGSFVGQALQGVGKTLTERTSRRFPAFGRATGIIVNYTPDRAVRYDLEGNALEVLPYAYRLGDAEVFVGGRPIPPGFGRAVAPEDRGEDSP